MPDSTLTVSGLKELNQKLYQLRDKVAENATRRAVYAGAKVIRDKMRAQAPVGKDSPSPGELKKSITVRTKVVRREGKVIASIGPKKTKMTFSKTVKGEKKKFKRSRQDAVPRSEARWLEFGVRAHPLSKQTVAFQGKVVHATEHPGFAPKPFMVPSAEQGFQPAVSQFKDVLKQEIDKAAK